MNYQLWLKIIKPFKSGKRPNSPSPEMEYVIPKIFRILIINRPGVI